MSKNKYTDSNFKPDDNTLSEIESLNKDMKVGSMAIFLIDNSAL